MTQGNDLTCVFTGSFINVKFYQERLEEIGIASLCKDDLNSRTMAGIGGIPDSSELFVTYNNAEKAKSCIRKLQEE